MQVHIVRFRSLVSSPIPSRAWSLPQFITSLFTSILSFIHKEKEKEDQSLAKTIAPGDSALRKSFRKDLTEIYNALEKWLNGIQDTVNETLTCSGKLLANTESVTATTKDLTGKVGKITDTADRIATDTSKYHDAVLTKPAQTL